jgi:methylglutaconyl-CoA hydratase
MPYNTVKLDCSTEIATLTLNRPERHNALSPAMMDDLMAALEETASSAARVLILTGAGRSFCSGADLESLRALAAQSPEQSLEDARHTSKFFRRLYTFPKPLIAAVNGAALAGGCAVATMADFTLAVPEAQFGYTEVRVGFMPALVSAYLVRQMGEKRAGDLLLGGRVMGAEEAFGMDLVTEIVSRKKLLPRAAELAGQLLRSSPVSLQFTKRLLRQFSEAELDRETELAIQASTSIRSTEDFREGLSAFLEKRKPIWRGR